MIGTFARTLALVFGTGFGAGYFPIAPGTVGSAVGVVIYLALVRLRVLSASNLSGWLSVAAAVFAAGCLAAWALEKRYGPDNRRIVVDEIWGMLVSLAFLPPQVGYVVAGFLLFRVFDIVKPFPGRRAERVGSGVGVMLDDGVAGVYACVVLHLARIIAG